MASTTTAHPSSMPAAAPDTAPAPRPVTTVTPLTLNDHCDHPVTPALASATGNHSCGAAATHQAHIAPDTSPLLFCTHHFQRVRLALPAAATTYTATGKPVT